MRLSRSLIYHLYDSHRHLHSFPTRRSSDLRRATSRADNERSPGGRAPQVNRPHTSAQTRGRKWIDRKSTRLNSSHSQISYAVFCLKKKKDSDLLTPEPPLRETDFVVRSGWS